MYNRCMRCRRRFNPDLRFCPYCGGEAKAPKTRQWRYEDLTLVGHEDPVDGFEGKAYRQNGFLLLVAVILIIPAMLLGIQEFVGLDPRDQEAELLVAVAYFIAAFVLIAYGSYCAFAAKRPGIQVLAAFLLWVNPGILHPAAFLSFGILFGLAWAMGSAKSGSWTRPDASFLGLMTVVGILALIWGYLWLMNQYYSFLSMGGI